MKNRLLKLLITFFNLAILACLLYAGVRLLFTQPPQAVQAAQDAGQAGVILWGPRAFDLLLQAVILFTGILGIILLFRKEDQK